MKASIYFACIAMALCLSHACQQEDVDPNDFRRDGQPKDNTYVLRDGTAVLLETEQDQLIAVDDASVRFDPSSTYAANVEIGDIIVNPFGGTNAFLRRVTGISAQGDAIVLQTEQAQMTEAFSAWVIDSRTSTLTLKNRSGWEESYSFSEEIGGVEFSFGGAAEFQITLEPSYDDYGLEYYWEEGNPDYVNGPYIRFYLENFNIEFNGKLVTNLSTGASLSTDAGPFSIGQIPYANFLSLYVQPNAGINVGMEGTFTSPEVTHTFGPLNVDAGYDNETSELFSESFDPPVLLPQVSTPTIDNLSGQARATLGVDFIIALTGQYESGLEEVAEMKFAVSTYIYQDYIIQHKGNFDDRQPRITFGANMGVGFNFGVEFNLFGGTITEGLSSEDEEYEWFRWNLASINTCDQFPSASLEYAGGVVDISMGSAPDHNIGYNIWINDELYSDQLFSYDQTHTIDLPTNGQLVNKISITDYYSLACYLEDIYVDPSLVGNCSDKFVDPRDGNEYCYADIGGNTWMTENLRYTGGGAIGKWYNNVDNDENLIYGRLYQFDEIGNICPAGWHMPSNAEWNQLINALGGEDEFGRNAKAASSVLWPGSELPDETTFGAVPAGEYYSWLEGNSQYSAYGNKGKYARFWSATILDDAPTMIEVSASNEGEVNTGNSASLIGLNRFKSIREIGFSCRCVRD